MCHNQRSFPNTLGKVEHAKPLPQPTPYIILHTWASLKLYLFFFENTTNFENLSKEIMYGMMADFKNFWNSQRVVLSKQNIHLAKNVKVVHVVG